MGDEGEDGKTDPRVRVIERRQQDVEHDNDNLGRKVRTWQHLNAALVLSVVLAIGGFYQVVTNAAEAQGKKGLAKAEQVEAALLQHVESEERQRLEIRNDIRDLYKYLLTKQRQPGLEKKLDAGSNDGGDDR